MFTRRHHFLKVDFLTFLGILKTNDIFRNPETTLNRIVIFIMTILVEKKLMRIKRIVIILGRSTTNRQGPNTDPSQILM